MNGRISRSMVFIPALLLYVLPAIATRADTYVRYGPAADVAAVGVLAKKASASDGPSTLGPIVVVGATAYVNVYNEGSAEIFFKKVGGKWKIVETNGGVGTAATYAQFSHGALSAAQICALGHHIPD